MDVIFAWGYFEVKQFLNDVWYEHETKWLFLTLTNDYFPKKNIEKSIKFQGVLVLVGKVNNVYVSWKTLDTTLYSPAAIMYRPDFINCRPTKKIEGAFVVSSLFILWRNVI